MKSKVLLFNLPPAGGNLYPVSLGYIAASLTKHSIETAIAEIDEITPRTGQSIANFVIDFKPCVVGFSVYQANIKLAVQLAKLIKMIDPFIYVVIGGPQATFMPAGALSQMPSVDAIVRGEGEVIMPALVKALERKSSLSRVKGIAFKKGGKIFETSLERLTTELNHFPSPYKSGSFDLAQKKVAVMLTSRGCYFNCAFCYTPRAFNRTIRAHSPARVLDDMGICVKQGISKFFFADPSFTFDKKRVEKIMRGIIAKKWKINIWCETRADLIDEKLLALMARAGVSHVAYGLESSDEAVNNAINKTQDLARFEKIVKVTQSLGIETEVFTLYGLPGQTLDSAVRTVDLLKRLGIKITGNSAGQQLMLFFGTDITDDPEKYGIRVLKNKRRPLYLSAGHNFRTGSMGLQDIAAIAKRYAREGKHSAANLRSHKPAGLV